MVRFSGDRNARVPTLLQVPYSSWRMKNSSAGVLSVSGGDYKLLVPHMLVSLNPIGLSNTNPACIVKHHLYRNISSSQTDCHDLHLSPPSCPVPHASTYAKGILQYDLNPSIPLLILEQHHEPLISDYPDLCGPHLARGRNARILPRSCNEFR
jgi:hypothetical protein